MWHVANLAIAIGATLAPAPAAVPTDCRAFLAGAWTGRRNVQLGSEAVRVDNRAVFNQDGSALTISRFLDRQGVWQEQRVGSTWTARRAERGGLRDCGMILSSTDGGAFTSTGSFTIVDPETFEQMGLNFRRARD